MGITARAYCGEDDYARIRDLLAETFTARTPPLNCGLGDLDWWRYSGSPDRIARARLWEGESGKLLGVAWPGGNEVDLFVHPDHRQIEEEMLVWSEEQRAAGKPPDAEEWGLLVWGTEGDQHREGLLHQRGYERTELSLNYWVRSLDDPIPPGTLPKGYSIRNSCGEKDLRARVAVHRDAFDSSRYTVESHRAVMGAPTYRPDLDLVVVAPDGEFAAFCIVWFQQRHAVGIFEPVACHPRHRRRGLTKAILYEGIRRIKKLGATTATVEARGGNAAANRLYETTGFRVLGRYRYWKKVL